MDILSALVTRLQERFRNQVGTVLPSLMDRLGDAKDAVRDQDQALLLKIMDQAANPQIWISKPDAQQDSSSHLQPPRGPNESGLPQSRLNVIFSKFDEVQRSGDMVLSPVSDKNFEEDDSVDGGRSTASSKAVPVSGKKAVSMGSFRRPGSASSAKAAGKDAASAGAVDEEDILRLHSNRELEEAMAKIRDVLSDDKRDWELRVAALRKVRSLLLAGATDFDAFPQQLRLMEAAFKMSAKDLRSQVVREACITLGHLSLLLGSGFDHAAEATIPVLLNLLPNSAKIMATSGVAAVRIILRNTHYPRLIPVICTHCTCKSVAIRRRCFEFLDLMLQEWQSSSLERHGAVIMDTIKKGVHDADSEARSLARKCYWSFHGQFSREAELLFQGLESSYQKALQAHMKSGDSQESLNRPVKSSVGSSGARAFPSASALPPGSYASLGRVRTRKQSSGPSVTDTRGRSRGKVVSQSQPGSRSGSPGRLLGPAYGRVPSVSQGCSRDGSRESSRDGSPTRGFSPLVTRRHSRSTSALSAVATDCYSDRLSHQARISASVNAMKILDTGTEVEAAVADALRRPVRRRFESPGVYSDDEGHSDASSACSERSYGSRNGGSGGHYLRQTEDVAEVLNHCASANWSERKDGLLGLQNLLKSQRTLSRVELKRLCEIFTRMFADPHSKVFSMFLETLVDFVGLHHDDLQDWLFVLLTQLLKKMGQGAEGPGRHPQFNILMRFTVDQTQTPNLRVKVALLRYVVALVRHMDPGDFVNSSETRLAVSRVITWTTEPKSSEVRKASPSPHPAGPNPPRQPGSRGSPLTSPTNCSHGGLSP
ncbi:hypothetical protein NHX12_015067, partial [Muraenolepis orangiensis]